MARGGRGGAGNKRFATSTRQAPRFAERGTVGEAGWIELRLRLLADAGLIGLPNAGKSSLLARLTRAAPKVADYPFTTLEPILGTLEADDRQVVLADIPGLIEGAAEGAGLGHEFLAHIERCKMLIHLVDVAPSEGDPRANYDVVRAELASHGAGLEDLPEMVVLSKADLLTPEAREEVLAEWREHAGDDVLMISSATGEGLDDLRRAILARVPAEAPAPAATAAPAGFEAEHRVYRPAGEGGYSVAREDDGVPHRGPRRGDPLRPPRPQQPRGALLPRAAPRGDGRARGAEGGGLRAGRRGAHRRRGVRAAPRRLTGAPEPLNPAPESVAAPAAPILSAP